MGPLNLVNKESGVGSSERVPDKIFEHIKSNAREKEIYLDTIGGYIQHVHTLISLGSDQTVSKIAQLIKGESAFWVNNKSGMKLRLEWQEEYIAISVSESAVDTVREYIRNQEEHHRKKSFEEEYDELLRQHGFSAEGLKQA